MEYQFLLLNLCDLVVSDDNGVDDDDLANLVMKLGVPSIPNVHLVKDRGNTLFREGNFVLAAPLYLQALNLICFLGLPTVHDQPVAFSLCLSLVLNLAGCELKLSQYNRASCYCSFVLSFDPSNAKALYRRGLAFRHLNLLNKALEDFELAANFDPLNKDIKRELHSVVDLLIINVNGKRVAYPFNPLNSDKKGKKPLVDKFDTHVGLNEASCSTAPSPVTHHASSPHAEVEVTATSAFVADSDFQNATGSFVAAASSCFIPDFGNLNEVSSTPPAKDDYMCSKTFSSTNYSSNKKHPTNSLRLSSEDYENLLLRKDHLFLHPRSLSSLMVRPLISSNAILTGTPHEAFSREAVVPISEPLNEVRHQKLHLEPESNGLEEAVSHVAKKTRLSSDSSLDSQVRLVQFQFVAVKGKSMRKRCCRKVEHSVQRGRMISSRQISRKVSTGAIDNFLSFCRYARKGKVEATKGSKRKAVDLLQFADYYHPPFKKCRLSISSSFACNFSPVTSVSNSSGVSNSPKFVW